MRARLFLVALAAAAPMTALAQDRLFNISNFPAEMHGQARWKVAAHCVALYETHDEVMERSRADHRAAEAAKGRPLAPPTPETLAVFANMSAEAEANRRSMAEYGRLRLTRDRPGQNVSRIFADEVARQRIWHESLNRSAREYQSRATSCDAFDLTIASDRGFLRAGRPDRRDTADGPV